MIEPNEIDLKLKETFGLKNFLSLTNLDKRNRVELGQDYDGSKRIKVAVTKAIEELNSCFKGENLWLRVILWDKTDEKDLLNPVLESIKENLKYSLIEDNSFILYYFFDIFDIDKIITLVKSSIYYDLGIEPSINITCFYFNLETQILVNIYDDRGMDIVEI